MALQRAFELGFHASREPQPTKRRREVRIREDEVVLVEEVHYSINERY